MFVSGSYRSAFRLAVETFSSADEPPIASTLPLGRIVAFISMRACDIDGPYSQCSGVAAVSMISVVAVAGLPPPKIMTFAT